MISFSSCFIPTNSHTVTAFSGRTHLLSSLQTLSTFVCRGNIWREEAAQSPRQSWNLSDWSEDSITTTDLNNKRHPTSLTCGKKPSQCQRKHTGDYGLVKIMSEYFRNCSSAGIVSYKVLQRRVWNIRRSSIRTFYSQKVTLKKKEKKKGCFLKRDKQAGGLKLGLHVLSRILCLCERSRMISAQQKFCFK